MLDYKKEYERWLASDALSADEKAELKSIAGDEIEIESRFYGPLEFGTAGLRGILGVGTNRMNIYTVRRATQGLANYIIKQGGAAKGVAIADVWCDGEHGGRFKRYFIQQDNTGKEVQR